MRTLLFALLGLMLLAAPPTAAQAPSSPTAHERWTLDEAPPAPFTFHRQDTYALRSGEVIFAGMVTWTATAGAEGQPARLPIVFYKAGDDPQDERAVQTVYADEFGTYRVKLPDADYRVAVWPEAALNLPPTAQRYLDRQYVNASHRNAPATGNVIEVERPEADDPTASL